MLTTWLNEVSDLGACILGCKQEHMMTSFLLRREEEERVTSYSGRGESRISRVYYK